MPPRSEFRGQGEQRHRRHGYRSDDAGAKRAPVPSRVPVAISEKVVSETDWTA